MAGEYTGRPVTGRPGRQSMAGGAPGTKTRADCHSGRRRRRAWPGTLDTIVGMGGVGTEIVVVLVLLLANGVFAMSEISIVAARKVRLQQRADDGDRMAKAALALANAPTPVPLHRADRDLARRRAGRSLRRRDHRRVRCRPGSSRSRRWRPTPRGWPSAWSSP